LAVSANPCSSRIGTSGGEFDLIHSHHDFMALAHTRLVKTPVHTIISGGGQI
jgi:hypothetical protein